MRSLLLEESSEAYMFKVEFRYHRFPLHTQAVGWVHGRPLGIVLVTAPSVFLP